MQCQGCNDLKVANAQKNKMTEGALNYLRIIESMSERLTEWSEQLKENHYLKKDIMLPCSPLPDCFKTKFSDPVPMLETLIKSVTERLSDDRLSEEAMKDAIAKLNANVDSKGKTIEELKSILKEEVSKEDNPTNKAAAMAHNLHFQVGNASFLTSQTTDSPQHSAGEEMNQLKIITASEEANKDKPDAHETETREKEQLVKDIKQKEESMMKLKEQLESKENAIQQLQEALEAREQDNNKAMEMKTAKINSWVSNTGK